MEIQEKRLKDTFVELVRVPCPSLQESEEAALLVRRLQDLGLSVQVDEAGRKCGGTTGNVWGFLPGTEPGATRLFFEAHMDSVAPATGTHVMERDGVLYSDGTTTLGGDDKSGIAAVLEALAVVQEKHVPHGDIQVCFTIGEETGSYGVRNLDPAWIRADVGYALDSTGHPGAIYNASPQAMDVTYTVHGKTAHAGAEPEKGINAIMLAAQALAQLPAYGRLDERTTLSVDLMEGGLATNIVPDRCAFTIDMRCDDTDKLDRLQEEMTARFRRVVEAGGGTLSVEVKTVAPAIRLPEDQEAVRLAAEAARKLGFPVSCEFTGGCSDANFLCGLGLPSLLLATGMDRIHTTEERLALTDLYHAAQWVLEIIRLAGRQRPRNGARSEGE
ncbi:MAG: M20-dimer domain-containing protein [Succiniclasticum sp.]|jgi:tripeptide aminopeptidase